MQGTILHMGDAPISPSVIHQRTLDFFDRYLVSAASTLAKKHALASVSVK